ncbi:hypothetical protein LIER_26584 [Lithospermum erythrorhizon]|uniref:EGF-like domain-containing protein n=1 Tax=Lithospermum erythrorhizon TaxID=34254 RepID=A0AAV3RC38_LITER
MGLAALLEQSTSLLLMMIIMLVMRSVAETADFPIVKPGCDASCGNVSIPFPFGITKDCSLNADFLIDCNRSFIGTGYTPLLRNNPWINMSITSISIETSQLNVLQDVPAVACDGPATDRELKPFGTTPFTIDSSSNLLITKGCNIYSIFRGTTTVDHDPPTIIGCVPYCDYEFLGESCSRGIGCCLTNIPPGLVSFNAWLYSLGNNISVSRDNSSSCAFAFIAHKSVLDGSGQLNMTDPLKPSSMVPIVLNWFVFNDTCESVVKNSSNYACKEGSYCRNIEESVGYRCSCSPGYQGNPYLGCTDIDECDTSNHGCEHICRNQPGSYICECFPGYSSFGFKNETRCIQVKPTKSVAPIAGECHDFEFIVLFFDDGPSHYSL